MRLLRLMPAAALPFLLVACPADRPVDEPADPALAPAPVEADADREYDVELREVAGSGVTGEATLQRIGVETQVVVHVENAAPNQTLRGAVHRGTCMAVGEQLAPLPTIMTDADGQGHATGLAAIPGWPPVAGTPPEQHEALVVAYHAGGTGGPDEELTGQPIACGELHGNGGAPEARQQPRTTPPAY
jgi:hypothetical protein